MLGHMDWKARLEKLVLVSLSLWCMRIARVVTSPFQRGIHLCPSKNFFCCVDDSVVMSHFPTYHHSQSQIYQLIQTNWTKDTAMYHDQVTYMGSLHEVLANKVEDSRRYQRLCRRSNEWEGDLFVPCPLKGLWLCRILRRRVDKAPNGWMLMAIQGKPNIARVDAQDYNSFLFDQWCD